MVKFFNKYRLIILGILYTIYLIYKYVTDPNEFPKLIETPAIISIIAYSFIIALGLLYEYYFPYNKIRQYEIISGINESVSYNNVPFILRILNDDLVYSSDSGLNEKIIDSDVWDWTIITNHIDTDSRISIKLYESLEQSHLQNKEIIQTSSLIYIDDLTYHRDNIYILGNVQVPANQSSAADFPTLLAPKNQITFTAYYEYKSHIDQNKHHIRDAKSTREQQVILKKYSDLYDKYLENVEKKLVLCWKDKPPKTEDINSFFELIKELKDNTNMVLKSNMDLLKIIKELRQEKINWFFVSLFIIGFLLSPISFYNDMVVNIPLSYYLANLTNSFIQVRSIPICASIFYVLTNIIGFLLMRFSLIEVNKNIKLEYWNMNTFKVMSFITLLLLFIGISIDYMIFSNNPFNFLGQ